jgi:hypothetical protein
MFRADSTSLSVDGVTPYWAIRSCEYSRKDALFEQPRPCHLRDDRQRLHGAHDQVGIVVEFAIAVSVARHRRQLGGGVGWIANHHRRPRVRMHFRGAQPLLDKRRDERRELRVAAVGCRVDADET